jgi:predicted DNA-binding WGR domain protein
MLKLYKNINNKLHYWETWDTEDNSAIIHWGKVGETGEYKTISSSLFSKYKSKVQKEIKEQCKNGFAPFNEENLQLLEIEYKVEGFGTEADLEKRHELESKLNEILGWSGLGHVDGGSIGNGTMEVGCVVVDFNITKEVLETSLQETEFCDYTRIYLPE